MAAPDEKELSHRATRGDPVAVDELLVRHLGGLRAYVRLNVGPAIRAKESESDLVQSVCREILNDAADFRWEGEAAFRRWLYQTALRKILDRAKFYGRERRDLLRERAVESVGGLANLVESPFYVRMCSPSENAMAEERVRAIERAFDRLNERDREIVTLSRVCGLSTAELAAHFKEDEHYARTMLSRALARLARELQKVDGDDDPESAG